MLAHQPSMTCSMPAEFLVSTKACTSAPARTKEYNSAVYTSVWKPTTLSRATLGAALPSASGLIPPSARPGFASAGSRGI